MALSKHDRFVLENIFNPSLPLSNSEIEPAACAAKNSDSIDEKENWKLLEQQGIEAAEKGNLDHALDIFNEAVILYPENPACYNNRAQLLRMKGDISNAKNDLNLAIEKSEGKGASACQAYTQRAMIRRLEGDDAGCRSDFKFAADLGSAFAKQQLVALNPYAALCNSMLSEIMCKLRQSPAERQADPTQ